MSTPVITWQSVVDKLLIKPSNASHVCIYDIASKDLLAASENYWLPPDDVEQFLDAFKNPEHYLVNHIRVWRSIPEVTRQFLVCKADSRSMYCKCGATSCFAAVTEKTLVVAFCEPPVLPGRTANAVELLIDQLITHNQ